ncbi:MAG: nitrite reductase, copper-containing [Euryarchaeota archaeon RBG_16_67_27]|nr:MAG: nitrite reductase, copper-containing [Euryarchaeota archaeon RBG_16_67_27]
MGGSSSDEMSRTMKGVNPLGKGGVALVVTITLLVGIIGGSTAGYYLGQSLAGPQEPAAGEVTFTLRAKISGFEGIGGTIDGDVNPLLSVNKGDRVTIVLVGGEANMHDWFVEGYNAKTGHVTSVGQQQTVTFTADQEGTFAYYCTVPGHRTTMNGQFIVGSGQGGGGTLPPIGPVKPVDVSNIAKGATDLPSPLNRTTPTSVDIFLDAREVVAWVERWNPSGAVNSTLTYWTYNGTVPGPFFRVLVNDTVTVHFSNNASSTMTHSVDFHAVTGPGGGAASTQTAPGATSMFTFKALNPGLYVYHCASPHIPTHISLGMYGLILVEPDGGLPWQDAAGRPIREFYVMQGDIYTKWPTHSAGHQEFDDLKLLNEEPTYVVFNGRYQALTGSGALRANVNDTVRIFLGVGGPNLISSFHVIGEIFDRVYLMGDLVSAPQQSVQTTLVAPGGSAMVEFKVQVPATYILVDHALSRTIDKGALGQLVVSGAEDPTVYDGAAGGS